MTKSWTYVGLLGIAFGMSGCGGASRGTTEGAASGELDLAVYQATLSDGTLMSIDFTTQKNGLYCGSFALGADKGTYAYQTGTFYGSCSGGLLTADCTTIDGKTFQLTGTVNQGLQLTRSDAPGEALKFTRLAAPAASRSTMSFFLDGLAGTKGTVTLNATPSSTTVSGSTTIREYKGTWQGVPATFWSYNNGAATLTVFIDPLCIMNANYAAYLPSDFGTKTLTAGSGYMTMYNTSLRAQLKFKTLPIVSP